MKLLMLSLALSSFCFAQNNPRGAATHQVSKGACSINASEVHGNVSISIAGPACNNLSGADVALIRQLVQLLQEDIEAHRSQPASSTYAGDEVPGPTRASASPTDNLLGTSPAGNTGEDQSLVFKNISGLNSYAHYAGLQQPILSTLAGNPALGPVWVSASPTNDSPDTSLAGIVTADQSPQFKNISGVIGYDQAVGFQQPVLSTSTGNPALGPAWVSASLTSNLSGTSSVGIVTADQSPQFKNISGVIGYDQAVGFQQPVFSTSTGNPALGPAWASASLNPVGITGANQSSEFKNISGLVGDDHAADLPPATSTFAGHSTITQAWNSVSLTFTNTPVGQTSTLTGTDLTSLSKTLSDLTSGGHVITGWTLTYYLTDGPP